MSTSTPAVVAAQAPPRAKPSNYPPAVVAMFQPLLAGQWLFFRKNGEAF